MKLNTQWHVYGITGDHESTTTVMGSEYDCRMVAKLMVSAGVWDNAYLYPPGSRSGPPPDGIEVHEPFEVYTVPNMCGVQGMERDLEWRGWENQKFDE